MTNDDACADIPPGWKYHLVKGNAPSIYYWFWPIGGLCWLIVLGVLIPQIVRLRQDGLAYRNRNQDVFVAKAFDIGFQICCYPILLATAKFLVLLCPALMFSLDFIAISYEAYCIYLFAQFLIMLMGGHKKSTFIIALTHERPTKYWTSFPLACCFRCLEREKHMTRRHFLIAYGLIIQFCISAPFWSFLALSQIMRGDNSKARFPNICSTISATVCIYGLFVLMRGTSGLLAAYQPRGKFFSIQALFLSTVFPNNIMSLFDINTSENHRYNTTVMREAWACFITLILCAIISFAYKRFWHRKDCRSAQISSEQGTIIEVPSVTHSYENLKELYDHPTYEQSVTRSQHGESVTYQATQDDTKNTHLLQTYS